MRSVAVKAIVVAVCVGAAVFALSGAAEASHVVANVTTTPEQVGHPATVQVALRSADGGLPVANTPVIFYTQGSFGRITGEVELGRAVTNQDGVAVLNYQPRSPGDHQIRIEYVTAGDNQPEAGTSSISVADGPQLFRSTAGIHVPGLGAWLIIAFVTAVWAILFSVALRVLAIARAGTDAETVPGLALHAVEEEGWASTQRAGTSEA